MASNISLQEKPVAMLKMIDWTMGEKTKEDRIERGSYH